MLAVQKAGSWQTLAGLVRVYKAHRCEDPSWNRGRPRTTVRTDVGVVDVATGELEPDDEDDEQTDTEWRAEARAKDRERALRKMSTPMQFVMLHDCPECAAPKGEPCQSVGGWPIPTVCRQRKAMAAFGEGQFWPPRPNQIGYRQMKTWLTDNATVLTGGT